MTLLRDKRVLLVHGAGSDLLALVVALESNGARVTQVSYEMFLAENGRLSPYLNDTTDLIMLDYTFSDQTYMTVLSELQKHPAHLQIPVIVIIEAGTTKRIEEVIMHGASDYTTTIETVPALLNKIKVLFGEDTISVQDSAIDLSEIAIKASSKKIKVFVVEDDPLLRNLLKSRFEQANIPYFFNSTGQNVPTEMLAFKPHVLVLDLMLPGRSGFDVLSEIQHHEPLVTIPVVVLSNRDNPEDRQRAANLGVKNYFVKAVTNLSKLIEVLHTVAEE